MPSACRPAAARASRSKSLGVITGNTWERDDNGNIIFHELSASQKALYGGEYVTTYNQNTLDELGNFHPDFNGGFNTSISFKNFRLSANIDFSVGGQIVSYTCLLYTSRCV